MMARETAEAEEQVEIKPVHLKLERTLVDEVDEWAWRHRMNRTDAIRALLKTGMAAPEKKRKGD